MVFGRRPRYTGVRVSERAAGFTGGAGRIGVLLCHGLTGSPRSLGGWADHLAGEGYAVSVPLLPGHGTTWQELATTGWPDWYATVDNAFEELQQACEQVFVAGLSMGGALALRLAEQRAEVAGLVLVNPSVRSRDLRFAALPALSRVKKSIPGITDDIARPGVSEFGYDRMPLRALVSLTQLWAEVRAGLPRVTQPILVFRSETDHVVDPSSMQLLQQLVGSAQITERLLHRSFHVATLDYEAEDIFRESAAFIAEHSVPARGGGDG